MSEEKKDEQKEETSASAEATADKSVEVKEEKSTDPIKPSDEDNEVKIPAKFKGIVEEIEKMSVLDLSELVKLLEDKFGVSAVPAGVGLAGVPAGVGLAGEGAEEKDSYDVELTGVGDNKIGVIKVVREVTAKGLKDAKDMVEAAPTVIKEGVKKDEAEEIKKKVEEAGGQVNLK